jgi:hypothetical protein
MNRSAATNRRTQRAESWNWLIRFGCFACFRAGRMFRHYAFGRGLRLWKRWGRRRGFVDTLRRARRLKIARWAQR